MCTYPIIFETEDIYAHINECSPYRINSSMATQTNSSIKFDVTTIFEIFCVIYTTVKWNLGNAVE